MRIRTLCSTLALTLGTACVSTTHTYRESAFGTWEMEVNADRMVRLISSDGRSTFWVGPVSTMREARMLVNAVLTDQNQDYGEADPCGGDWDDRADVSRTEINACVSEHDLNPVDFWSTWASTEAPDSIDVTNWIYE